MPQPVRPTLLKALMTPALLAGAPAGAADFADAATADSAGDIVVTGYRAEGLSDIRSPLALLDTPVAAAVITDELLAQQGRRTLRDALRNISGISFQAGEGNPPGGGDSFSIRGFSARDDIFVDGIRDPGNYFRDPFNADRIEVTKGPGSAFAGRGNIGGTVNIVTRQPVLETRAAFEAGVGTASFLRGTADINLVLARDPGLAVRINALGHRNDEPGRDVARSERWAINPVVGLGIGGPVRLTLGWFHMEQDDQPDMGIPNARNRSLAGTPFAGRPAPVDRRNYYGYSTDFREGKTDIFTAAADARLSDAVSLRNVSRWARVRYDQEASSPRFIGNPTTIDASTEAVGNRKPRRQLDTLLTNQTQLSITAGPEGFRHNLAVGIEFVDEVTQNRRQLDADGPRMNLLRPVLQAAPPIPFNGTSARIDVETISLWAFDTVELGERLILRGGVRYDDVKSRVRGFDPLGIAPAYRTDLSITDRAWSGNLGLVVKPVPNASLFIAWGTAFEPSARAEIVQIAGGNNNPPVTPGAFQVGPERSRAFEGGAKLDLLGGQLSLSGTLFEITRTNARTPGVNPGDPPVVLEGRQRVRGAEFQAIGNLTQAWQVFANYTYLDGRVTRSNIPAQVGLRLDNSPEHSASGWTAYEILPGLKLGGGIQHVSSRRSDIPASLTTGNIVVTVPPYTVLDAFAEWQITPAVALRANVYNLADEVYFQSFNSAQSIPSPGRSAILTLAISR